MITYLLLISLQVEPQYAKELFRILTTIPFPYIYIQGIFSITFISLFVNFSVKFLNVIMKILKQTILTILCYNKIKKQVISLQERQDLSKIKITDNIMFTSVFSNLEIVKKFLELLLSINIKTIKVLQKEKAIDTIGKSRGVRFDVYLENDAAIYDIEIQTSNTYDLPKRTRYYHSSIDSDLLDKGEKSFNILKVSYVIFICTFNPFNVENINECIYKFEKMCILENKVLKLNDKSYDVFINSKCDLSKVKNNDVKAFIELLNNGYHSETKSELTNMIENEMSRLKENEEWRKEYMTLQEYDERMIVYVDMAKKMIKEKCSDEFILKIVDLSEEQLERIRYDVEHGYES